MTDRRIQLSDEDLEALLRKLIELEQWQTEMVGAGFRQDDKTLEDVGDKVLNRCAELSDQARQLLGLPSIRAEVKAIRGREARQ